MSMRLLSSAPDNSTVYVPLIKASSLDMIKKSILFDLFGVVIITIEHASQIPIQLQIAPPLTLSNKKLISLGKKTSRFRPKAYRIIPKFH